MMRDYLEYAKDHEIVNTKVSVYLIKRIGIYPDYCKYHVRSPFKNEWLIR